MLAVLFICVVLSCVSCSMPGSGDLPSSGSQASGRHAEYVSQLSAEELVYYIMHNPDGVINPRYKSVFLLKDERREDIAVTGTGYICNNECDVFEVYIYGESPQDMKLDFSRRQYINLRPAPNGGIATFTVSELSAGRVEDSLMYEINRPDFIRSGNCVRYVTFDISKNQSYVILEIQFLYTMDGTTNFQTELTMTWYVPEKRLD